MQSLEQTSEVSAPMERSIIVPNDANSITVQAEHHRWISVWVGDTEISRESGGAPAASFYMEPGSYVIRTDGTLRSVETGRIDLPPDLAGFGILDQPPTLRISSDAPDRHQVDGVGEIPADGTSAATVTLEKVGADGERLKGQGHTDEIFLRSTGGVIMAGKRETRIRSVKMRAGTATFRLVSDNAPKLVTVFAFSADQMLRVELPMEFV